MKLAQLNSVPEDRFLEHIHGPLEGEAWLAKRVLEYRPFADLESLVGAFESVMQSASEEEQIRLIASHPDLAIAVREKLSDASVREQASAGLNQLTPEEYAEFKHLNTAYRERFGFPFVICARENTKDSILIKFRERLNHQREPEIETGIAEVLKIIRLRLTDLLTKSE